jgi:hypothetical protein
MRKRRNVLWIVAVFLSFLCSSCFGSRGSEVRAVREALDAIDACYHWGGEVGDQSEARNKDILAGVTRDCPIARQKAESALKAYPDNPELAAAILRLIDVGYFDVTDVRRKHICTKAAQKFKREFEESRSEDVLFLAECAEQAATVYGP